MGALSPLKRPCVLHTLHPHCGESKPVLLAMETQPPTALAVLLALPVDTEVSQPEVIRRQLHYRLSRISTVSPACCVLTFYWRKCPFWVYLEGIYCELEAFVCADLAWCTGT